MVLSAAHGVFGWQFDLYELYDLQFIINLLFRIIDCKHFRVRSTEVANFNGRFNHATIVGQFIIDHQGLFTNAQMCCAGVTNDNTQFRNSEVSAKMERAEIPGFVIADGGSFSFILLS